MRAFLAASLVVVLWCEEVRTQSAPHQIPHGPISGGQIQAPVPQSQRKSENYFLGAPGYEFYAGGGYPGFFGGGYGGFGLSPQQNGDGSWNFVALPIPLENQTIPDDFPKDMVAQAKLWGPIYKEGDGWVYGEAGNILVPRNPPYAPPRFVTPPAFRNPATSSRSNSESSPIADGTVDIDTKTGRPIEEKKKENSRASSERLVAKKQKKPIK